jgi:hypothetical protein
MPELSGPDWVAQFPGSHDPNDCIEPFRTNLNRFLAALRAANASVRIAATFRPPARAFLMHHAWRIAHNEDPRQVGVMPGIDIDWVHRDDAGHPDFPKSRSFASQMVSAYGIVRLPALRSRHTEGRAIDMNIKWNGTLTIATAGGGTEDITSSPRTGMNRRLIEIGAGYSVIKASFANDPPHWSVDGH